jgi:gamma-glutamyltranspeptidase/glutathione hydrolase
LIPGFAVRNGEPWLAFGTRGADGQPQIAVQILTGLLDFALEPQVAVEAPRWVHGMPSATFPRDAVIVESRFGEQVAAELAARGHLPAVAGPLEFSVGSVQLIQVDSRRGYYTAASDPRGDGAALAV